VPLLEPPARLAQPGPPPMAAGNEALGIEVDLHAGAVPSPQCLTARLGLTPALEPFLSLAQCGPPPRTRPQLLGQLIAAGLTVELAPVRPLTFGPSAKARACG
jgi:hypothetical protein